MFRRTSEREPAAGRGWEVSIVAEDGQVYFRDEMREVDDGVWEAAIEAATTTMLLTGNYRLYTRSLSGELSG